jgi:hypothetical protein
MMLQALSKMMNDLGKKNGQQHQLPCTSGGGSSGNDVTYITNFQRIPRKPFPKNAARLTQFNPRHLQNTHHSKYE